MTRDQKGGLALAIICALVGTAYVSWVAGANYGDALIRSKVRGHAQSCHAMREMGITAFAIKMNLNGFYFPSQDCTKFYDIMGEKEPDLPPEAKKLEDEMMAKARAREAEAKKLSEQAKFVWR